MRKMPEYQNAKYIRQIFFVYIYSAVPTYSYLFCLVTDLFFLLFSLLLLIINNNTLLDFTVGIKVGVDLPAKMNRTVLAQEKLHKANLKKKTGIASSANLKEKSFNNVNVVNESKKLLWSMMNQMTLQMLMRFTIHFTIS
jgi:hypothetical protein